jgi:acyl carrier protein
MRNVPNSRLADALAAAHVIETSPPSARWVDARSSHAHSDEGVDPDQLHAAADAVGCAVEISWASSSETGDFDVLVTPKGVDRIRWIWELAEWVGGAGAPQSETVSQPALRRAAREDGQRIAASLHKRIEETLPRHMQPASLTVIPAFPLTANLKLDHARLPPPVGERRFPQSIDGKPRNGLEVALADLWSAMLGSGEVQIDDNFFELGGDSISAVRMASAATEATGRPVTVRDTFRYPTIRQLSEFMVKAEADRLPGSDVKCEV